MAILNRTITINGADAKVVGISLEPQADGSIKISVFGQTKDSTGKDIVLEPFVVKVQPGQFAPADNMLARGLVELRKANQLES